MPLVPAIQKPDSRKPFQYQVDAWENLNKHLNQSQQGVFNGLLVMPTGSGKTYTTVRWLMERVVNEGRRVLWIAHRYELLEQAAKEFHCLAGLATKRDRIRVRIVSGKHCSASQIDAADDVVLCSVASLARNSEIAMEVLEDPKLFLIIDEAHHAPAKSYRNLIENLGTKKRRSLLGLTATPTRTVDNERPVLSKLFGLNTIHQVEFRLLVEQGFLARPIPISVQTSVNVENGVTEDDRKHLEQFDDLSEAWQARIAHISERNHIIVKHYLKNKPKYGKTLIFAINIDHAVLLTAYFKEKGIRAAYVVSRRPDDDPADNKDIIEQFRDPNGLEVLVNVQILTEGFDLPGIQTVFLTRPTTSEILMRQMIGRALRGPKSGGHSQAFLVSFEDHWEQFRDFERPFALVPDILFTPSETEEIQVPGTVEPEEQQPPQYDLESLPWDLIRAIATKLSGSIDLAADAFEAVPHGWYILERISDAETICQTIPVYKHQQLWWDALLKHLDGLSLRPQSLESTTREALFDTYFADCDTPRPGDHDIGKILEHYRAGGSRPEYHDLPARAQCDPYELAEIITSKDMGPRDKGQLVAERYKIGYAKAIYPTLRHFDAAVNDALYEKEHVGEATRVRHGEPVFEPHADQLLREGPTHDLNALLDEVLELGKTLLGQDKLPFDCTIRVTKHIIKGWFGQAEQSDQPGKGTIRVNKLVDSPDVSTATMKFLIWHEYLHLYLHREGHTLQFNNLEKLWPNYKEADHELDTLNERFGIQYW